ncbi:MAG: FIST signal transduction protein [Phycisphaerales bacterium]
MSRVTAYTGESMHATAALSDHIDTRTAALEVIEQLSNAAVTQPSHLLTVFASFHHRAALAKACQDMQQAIGAETLIGCTAESVIGSDVEREGRAGLAVLSISMPGARVHPFSFLSDQEPITAMTSGALQQQLGVADDTRGVLLLGDPFTTRIDETINAIESCRGDNASLPICGGLASGASRSGCNVLMNNEVETTHGCVGVSISGSVAIDFVVSQGCRPIGTPLVVTKSRDHMVVELGGRPALEVVREIAESLEEADRALLSKGLFIGIVIDEYKPRFGRGDFLIRHIVSTDQHRQTITVAQALRPGQTVQLHVRDAQTASEDLSLLLDQQSLHGRPDAGLLFSCNGRGTRLFAEPDHDITMLQSRLGNIPMAGFFAAGEIGPIGARSFVHGHTACAMLFREEE